MTVSLAPPSRAQRELLDDFGWFVILVANAAAALGLYLATGWLVEALMVGAAVSLAGMAALAFGPLPRALRATFRERRIDEFPSFLPMLDPKRERVAVAWIVWAVACGWIALAGLPAYLEGDVLAVVFAAFYAGYLLALWLIGTALGSRGGW